MIEELFNSISATGKVILIAAVIVLDVLFIIAEWRIFKKAGEKGWKSLIPVYKVFLSHHIAGMSHIWFILEVICWIIEAVLEFVNGVPSWLGLVFGIFTVAFTVVSEVVHILLLCNRFGKKPAFKVGMILIPSLFFLIIAFGRSEYQKAE